MPHAGLKKILKKLVVYSSTSSFDFHDKTFGPMICICVKILFYFPIKAKKNGNLYFLCCFFSSLNLESC